MWQVRLFGSIEVQRGSEPAIRRFRSRSAASVLAYLALHIDRAVSRDELCEAIWADHEPELARSSLRTAVFSLRKQLVDPDSGPSPIDSDRNYVWLDTARVTTDYGEFVASFQRFESTSEREQAQYAFGLVKGSLLSGQEELWATPHQIAFEEMFSQLVVHLVATCEADRRWDEAFAIARHALTLAPFREDIHVALIRALNRAGKASEAIRQFEMLERLLDEQWGEAPSPEALRALEHKADEELPEETSAPQALRAVVETEVATPASGNLPHLSRRVFGRDPDVLRLVKELSPDSEGFERVWTVTGPGGSGKTVLALSVGHELQKSGQSLVVFVDLVSLRDENLIISSIADALQIPSPGALDVEKRLEEALNGTKTLLVLDNAEHLVAGVSRVVERLADRCPTVRFLVTSRRILGLTGERAYPVSALPFPELGQDLAQVSQVASVLLFIDRAQAIRPDFALTPANASAVIEICRRLDGLPLALELAAAQTSVMSPSQVLLRYGDHSLQLRNKLRNADERHRSLESVLEWSYDLLKPDEQRVFRALSVFRGSFNFEAVEVVADCPDAVDVLDTLLASSLVERIDTVDGFRFRLLGPICSYSSARAEEAGETEQLRERHLEHYLDFAESRRKEFQGPKVGEVTYEFDQEHENFRQIADWAVSSSDRATRACWLVGCMTNFITMRGHFVEWSRRIEELLRVADKSGSPLSVGFGHNVAGMLAFYAGAGDQAASHFEAAVDLFKKDGNLFNVAAAFNNLGMERIQRGRLDEASAAFEAGLDAVKKGTTPGLWVSDLIHIAVCGNLATLYRHQGKYQEALSLVQESLARAEQLQLLRIIPPLLLESALVYQCLDRTPESLELALKTESISESLGITANVADAQVAQAWCHFRNEDFALAEESVCRAMPWALRAQAANQLAEGLAISALLAKAPGQRAQYLRVALGLREQMLDFLAPWQRKALEDLKAQVGVDNVPSLVPTESLVCTMIAELTAPKDKVASVSRSRE